MYVCVCVALVAILCNRTRKGEKKILVGPHFAVSPLNWLKKAFRMGFDRLFRFEFPSFTLYFLIVSSSFSSLSITGQAKREEKFTCVKQLSPYIYKESNDWTGSVPLLLHIPPIQAIHPLHRPINLIHTSKKKTLQEVPNDYSLESSLFFHPQPTSFSYRMAQSVHFTDLLNYCQFFLPLFPNHLHS